MPRYLVLAHAYYEHLWWEISSRLKKLTPGTFDLYVSHVGFSDNAIETIAHDFPDVRMRGAANQGLDVGGMVYLLETFKIDLWQYDLILKVHTKNGCGDDWGSRWRASLLDAVLADPERVFRQFNDPGVVMAGCSPWIVNSMYGNQAKIEMLCDRMKLDRKLIGSHFVGGTMFWCRPCVLQPIIDCGLSQKDFEPGYAKDGLLAHAMERVFGILAARHGRIVGV